MKNLSSQFSRRKTKLSNQQRALQKLKDVFLSIKTPPQATAYDMVQSLMFKDNVLTIVATSKTAANELLVLKDELYTRAQQKSIDISKIMIR